MSSKSSAAEGDGSVPDRSRVLQDHQMESARRFLCDSSDDDDFDDDSDDEDEFALTGERIPPASKSRITINTRTTFKTVDRYPKRKTNLSGAIDLNKSCCAGNRRGCNTLIYRGSMKYKLNKIVLACVVAISLIVLLTGVDRLWKYHQAKKLIANEFSGSRLQEFGYKFIEMGLTRTVDFESTSSPQSLALEWIAETDGARLHWDDPLAYQRYALAVLYYTTAGTDDAVTPGDTGHWIEATHWMSDSGICRWYGVVCEGDDPTATDDSRKDHHGSVQSLELPGNGLLGWVPAELSALTNMYKLNLSSNKLWGTIPESFGASLLNLREMSLRSNDLDGKIPMNLAIELTNMRQLDLGDNRFKGHFPYQISEHMVELRFLALDQNELKGTIPALDGLAKLHHLSLEDNHLTGPFPFGVTELTNLEILSLGQNHISGVLPEQLEKLTSLEKLLLGEMRLDGTIPPEIFRKLTHLMEVRLSDNKLTGDIPTTIGQLKKLRGLFLGENRLYSKIPPQIGTATELVALNLHANELHGSIPDEIGLLANLEDVRLDRNFLIGTIPPEFGKLHRLVNLFVETNQLTGTLPSEIGSIRTLAEARFYENNFEGSMPEEICDLGTDEELVFLGADCSDVFTCPCCTKCF